MSNFTESQSQSQIVENFISFFSETSINFQSQEEENITFGKIILSPDKFNAIIKKLIKLEIYLDNSASMSDKCSDRKTKLNNMQFAIINSLRYLVKHKILVQVTVYSFDDTIIKVVDSTILCEENIDEIALKIDKITPNGGTNIAAVLDSEVAFKKSEDDTSDRIFAMFTDGQATEGRTRNNTKLIEIANKIDDSTTIATFGCGLDHDYHLLSGIAKRKNSSYKFIGKLEEAALIMGEFLDKILYKILTQVKISITNGEIYDWRTNSWMTEIATENIVAECNKTYNIRSNTPDTTIVTISAIIVETGEPFEYTIIDKNLDQDLRKDIYRQKTLECLFQANEYNRNICEETEIKIKTKLRDLLKDMKKFMDDNTLREDLFMKLLCDDIVTAFKTIGTPVGLMYTSSRQTTQGNQSIHNNIFEDDNLEIPSMTRGLTTRVQQMDDSLQIPTTKRGFSLQIQDMDDDLSYKGRQFPRMQRLLEEDEKEDDDSMFADLQNCSMMSTGLRRAKTGVVTFKKNIQEDVEDNDIFTNHKTLASDISPYENLKTITLMRDVSYTQPEKDDETNP